MANEAYELRPPIARRLPQIPLRVSLALCWGIRLLMRVSLCSCSSCAIRQSQVKTIRLETQFIRKWWLFVPQGVITTFELSIVSSICATILALRAALARLSRVAPLNSLAGLYA